MFVVSQAAAPWSWVSNVSVPLNTEGCKVPKAGTECLFRLVIPVLVQLYSTNLAIL